MAPNIEIVCLRKRVITLQQQQPEVRETYRNEDNTLYNINIPVIDKYIQ